MAEYTNKQVQQYWDDFREAIKASTPIDTTETVEQQKERIASLEKDPEAWFEYYFPKFAYAKPAPFHCAATKRVLNNPEWYEVRNWSRELAKDTRTMFEVLYLALTGKKKFILLVSNSYDNASAFLELYRIQLDSNPRIINDYGVQEKIGKWNIGDFTTRAGVRFRALGAGQSPRGTRNEEIRPDVIVVTDIDTDEDVKNSDTINKRWDWVERALIGTRSISKSLLVIFLGNIIAKDCCVVRAQEYADHVDVINIRDENGKSTWPSKNSEEHIDRVLSKISYSAQQGEYFNNPITKGTIFEEMHYKRLPSIKGYQFLVCYIDFSYKSSKKNDFKAATLMGKWKDEYHVLKAFLLQGSTSKFAEGLAMLEKWVAEQRPVFWMAEENFLQDIIRTEVQGVLKNLQSKIIITPDTRNKGDKLTRIEAALEPLNRNGKLYLNEAEKDDPHMKLLDGQFTALDYSNKKNHDDGPDSVEGGKYIIDQKIITSAGTTTGKRPAHKHSL